MFYSQELHTESSLLPAFRIVSLRSLMNLILNRMSVTALMMFDVHYFMFIPSKLNPQVSNQFDYVKLYRHHRQYLKMFTDCINFSPFVCSFKFQGC